MTQEPLEQPHKDPGKTLFLMLRFHEEWTVM
jgi:hypothetical protein